LASYSESVLTLITYFSAGALMFNPVIGAGLFVASRLSAWVSAFGSWGTNQIRLKANKIGLNQQTTTYYALKAEKNKNRHEFIEGLVSESFVRLNVKEGHQYSPWVYLRAYKALDAALQADITDFTGINSQSIVTSLTGALQGFITPSGKFSREKLRRLGEPEVSVLDSLPLLEAQLFESLSNSLEPAYYPLISKAVDRFANKRLAEPKQATSQLFCYQLKSSLANKPATALNKQALTTAFQATGLFTSQDKKFSIDPTKAEDKDRIQSAHGSALPPNRYGKKVAQAVAAKIPSLSRV